MARSKLDIPTQLTAASNGVAQVSGGVSTVSTVLANGTTAATQSAHDNSTKVATTAYVDAAAGSGTVTTVSVATANGFQGTVANPTTTPAISVNVDGTHYLPTTTDQTNWNAKQAAGNYITALTGKVIASGPGSAAATVNLAASDVPFRGVGFAINNGSTGTNIGPMLAANIAGVVNKCVIVTKASDGVTALTFKIKKNGTNVFSADPTITAGTASGTVTTSTSLTSVPLSIAANDVFSIDITSGTTSWQFTAQLEP